MGSQAGLLYVDIDGFKELNDHHGHQVGDQLLREVATRLRNTVRGDDVVARLGGDEFAVILPRVSNDEEIHAAAQRVHDAVAAPFALGDRFVHILVSVGEAMSPTHGTTIDALVSTPTPTCTTRRCAGELPCTPLREPRSRPASSLTGQPP